MLSDFSYLKMMLGYVWNNLFKVLSGVIITWSVCSSWYDTPPYLVCFPRPFRKKKGGLWNYLHSFVCLSVHLFVHPFLRTKLCGCCNSATTGPVHSKATFTYARSGNRAETGGFWLARSDTAGMFTHTRSGRGRICHLLRTQMVWSARFRSGRGKLGVGPICCGADFASAPRPLMCERM